MGKRFSSLISSIVIMIAVFFPAMGSLAHRLPETQSTIEVQEINQGGLVLYGITHRLHAHDAMQVLQYTDHASRDLENPATQQYIEAYALAAFQLRYAKRSKLIEQSILGSELKDDYIFVYTEFTLPIGIADIHAQAELMDFKPHWQNRLNMTSATPMQSFTFNAQTTDQMIALY